MVLLRALVGFGRVVSVGRDVDLHEGRVELFDLTCLYNDVVSAFDRDGFIAALGAVPRLSEHDGTVRVGVGVGVELVECAAHPST